MASKDKGHHGLSGWAVFIIVVIILLLAAAAGFFLYLRIWKRRSQSSNYPAPAPSGIVGWFNDTMSKFKRGRSRQTGAGYEAAGASGGYGGGGARRGILDPDEAWDSNVANEAYYEEQELGLHAPTGYTGAGYGASSPGFEPSSTSYPSASLATPATGHGRSKSKDRELDARYTEETGRRENPFGDEHAATSLRSVSPRPIDTNVDDGGTAGHHAQDDSPTGRKKSMFQESV